MLGLTRIRAAARPAVLLALSMPSVACRSFPQSLPKGWDLSYYEPTGRGFEAEIAERMRKLTRKSDSADASMEDK